MGDCLIANGIKLLVCISCVHEYVFFLCTLIHSNFILVESESHPTRSKKNDYYIFFRDVESSCKGTFLRWVCGFPVMVSCEGTW